MLKKTCHVTECALLSGCDRSLQHILQQLRSYKIDELNMSDLLQRTSVEKEVILSEIQLLKDKANAASNLTFLKETEKDYWNKLLDSNIRAGTMACMWCMKAQVVKRISVAFFKWKYNFARPVDGNGGSQINTPRRSSAVEGSRNAPISEVLARAISLVNHVKEHEVERELKNSALFMSPSASVQAANAAATSVLQLDAQSMPTHVGSGGSVNGAFPWESRRRAGSFSSLTGQQNNNNSDHTASGEFKLQHDEEALAAYNKQRLAYVLRSLHQQQDAQDTGAPAGTGVGAGTGQRQEIDAYLEEALHDPRVDAAAKREILMAMSYDMLSKPNSAQSRALSINAAAAAVVDNDANISTRSNLSLLRAPGSNPGTSASYSNTPTRSHGSRAGARSMSPTGRLHARSNAAHARPSSLITQPGFFAEESAYNAHSDGNMGNNSYAQQGGDGRAQDQFDGRLAPTAAEEAFFTANNRTYPPSSGPAMSLRSSHPSSGTSSQQRGRPQLPRYLMPTNSFRKKQHTPEKPSLADARRSRSPTMITNSNSKHANNVAGASSRGGGSPPAYTIRAALIRSKDNTPQNPVLAALQGPPKTGQTSPKANQPGPPQQYASQHPSQQLSYGKLSFYDYQQRRMGAQSQYSPNTPSMQGGNGNYYAPPLPPPYTPYNTGSSLPLPPNAGGAYNNAQSAGQPLRDAAMASIAEVDRMVQQGAAPPPPPPPSTRPSHSGSFELPAAVSAHGNGNANGAAYDAYDAYHSSSLRTNSVEIAEGEAAERAVTNPFTTAYYESTDEGVPDHHNDEDPHRISSVRNTQHFAQSAEGSYGAVNSNVYQPQGQQYQYQYPQQYQAHLSQQFQQQEQQFMYTPSSSHPEQGNNNNHTAQRRSGGSHAGSHGGQKDKPKEKKVDKAQLALFMHGEVKGKPSNWHATLRR